MFGFSLSAIGELLAPRPAPRSELSSLIRAGHFDQALDLIQKRKIPDKFWLDDFDARGMSPIHLAAAVGNMEIVVELISQGVSIDLLSQSGRAAIHYAAQNNRKGIVDILMRSGADPSLPDIDGLVAAELTEKSEIKEILLRGRDIGRDPYKLVVSPPPSKNVSSIPQGGDDSESSGSLPRNLFVSIPSSNSDGILVFPEKQFYSDEDEAEATDEFENLHGIDFSQSPSGLLKVGIECAGSGSEEDSEKDSENEEDEFGVVTGRSGGVKQRLFLETDFPDALDADRSDNFSEDADGEDGGGGGGAALFSHDQENLFDLPSPSPTFSDSQSPSFFENHSYNHGAPALGGGIMMTASVSHTRRIPDLDLSCLEDTRELNGSALRGGLSGRSSLPPPPKGTPYDGPSSVGSGAIFSARSGGAPSPAVRSDRMLGRGSSPYGHASAANSPAAYSPAPYAATAASHNSAAHSAGRSAGRGSVAFLDDLGHDVLSAATETAEVSARRLSPIEAMLKQAVLFCCLSSKENFDESLLKCLLELDPSLATARLTAGMISGDAFVAAEKGIRKLGLTSLQDVDGEAEARCAGYISALRRPALASLVGMTPIHIAAACYNVAAVRSLAACDASVWVRDLLGRTPLHLAAMAVAPELARLEDSSISAAEQREVCVVLRESMAAETGVDPTGEDAPVDLAGATPLGLFAAHTLAPLYLAAPSSSSAISPFRTTSSSPLKAKTDAHSSSTLSLESASSIPSALFSQGDPSVLPKTLLGGRSGKSPWKATGSGDRENVVHAHSWAGGWAHDGVSDFTFVSCPVHSRPAWCLFGLTSGQNGALVSSVLADQLPRIFAAEAATVLARQRSPPKPNSDQPHPHSSVGQSLASAPEDPSGGGGVGVGQSLISDADTTPKHLEALLLRTCQSAERLLSSHPRLKLGLASPGAAGGGGGVPVRLDHSSAGAVICLVTANFIAVCNVGDLCVALFAQRPSGSVEHALASGPRNPSLAHSPPSHAREDHSLSLSQPEGSPTPAHSPSMIGLSPALSLVTTNAGAGSSDAINPLFGTFIGPSTPPLSLSPFAALGSTSPFASSSSSSSSSAGACALHPHLFVASRGPRDAFLLLLSPGAASATSQDEAVHFVSSKLGFTGFGGPVGGISTKSAAEACDALLHHCLRRGARGNLVAMLIVTGAPPPVPAPPPALSARVPSRRNSPSPAEYEIVFSSIPANESPAVDVLSLPPPSINSSPPSQPRNQYLLQPQQHHQRWTSPVSAFSDDEGSSGGEELFFPPSSPRRKPAAPASPVLAPVPAHSTPQPTSHASSRGGAGGGGGSGFSTRVVDTPHSATPNATILTSVFSGVSGVGGDAEDDPPAADAASRRITPARTLDFS